MRQNQLVIGVLVGAVSVTEAAKLQQKALPPYWDGYYSKTWRYAMPEYRAMNPDEYAEEDPKGYSNAVAAATSLAQADAYGDYRATDAINAAYNNLAQDNDLDGVAWKTKDFYDTNEKEYREGTPKGYDSNVDFKGEALGNEEMYKMKQADAAETYKKGVEWHGESQHTHPLSVEHNLN
jgi:hypothetical protein